MKIGACVLCEKIGPLTEDHFPIKAVSPAGPIEIISLGEYLNSELAAKAKPRRGFQAPTFPSICAHCNNDLLGARYDPVLADFSKDVMVGLRAAVRNIFMPGGFKVTTKPLLLARAIVGHFIAAEHRKNRHELPQTGDMYRKMKVFFLDENAPWPDNLYFSLWPYNDKKIFLSRGFGYINALQKAWGPMVGDVVKFCPVSFLVSDIDPSISGYSLTRLPLNSSLAIQDEVTFEIGFENLPPFHWPQAPGDTGAVLMDMDRAIVARPI